MLANIIEGIYNLVDRWHAARIRKFYSSKNINFVVDVGAHKGEFINLVVDKTMPVYVFEPQSSVRKKLKANVKNHNIKKIYNCALSDYDGEINLYLGSLSSITSTLFPNRNSNWTKFKEIVLGGELLKGTENVPVYRLDNLMEEELSSINNGLLKIDVEGNEGAVLAGASSLCQGEKFRYIQIEVSSYSIHEKAKYDPSELLRHYGYSEAKRFIFPFLHFTDIIFVKNDDCE